MSAAKLDARPLGRWAKCDGMKSVAGVGRVGGAVCVAFFLVKGLVWLGIFAAAALHVLTR